MNIVILSLFCILPNKYEFTCDQRSIVVEAERVEFQDYVSLKDLSEVLNINYVLDNATQQLFLTGNGHKVVIMANVSTIMYDGDFQNIPFAPLYIGGEVYFPIQAVTTTLGSMFEKLIFITESKEIPIIDKISIFSKADSTVLGFKWQKPVDFDVQFALRKAIVEIDGVYKGTPTLKGVGAISNIKLSPFNTYTQLEFDLKDINSVIERENEIVFYKKITKKVAVIAIDAGHGGIDPGAIGKKGLYEKDVNLAIARVLLKLIEDSLRIKVVLTRDRDIYLPLKERTIIANRNAADLFVSIHCNAYTKGSSRTGFETYFLSEAKTNDERAVAARENASLQFDGVELATDDVSFILYDLAQSAFLEESNLLAEYIQTSAERHLKIPSRGVKQAGFYVLHGAFMPAVLVECAFISSPEEEKLLREKAFRNSLASCIYHGIKNFITDYERRLNN